MFCPADQLGDLHYWTRKISLCGDIYIVRLYVQTPT
jgi:hypothetical protein